MGEMITLTAADGHQLGAYRADPPGDTNGEPKGAPRGAIVVIQEIFGVNIHIRDVADRFAAEGYLAIAPVLFDRFEKGVELGYGEDNVALGREYKAKANANLDNVMADVQAAWEAVRAAGPGNNKGNNKVGVIGYCWGGVVVWAAACRLDFDAASGYYGSGIIELKDETPKCPTMLHFGKHDGSIPMADVDAISSAHPEVSVYVYDAGHGFNCDRRDSYDAEAAKTALKRTLDFFSGNLG